MSIGLQPLGDHLIVEPTEGAEVTASGIIIPEIARKRLQEGEVLAVGPGHRDKEGKRIPMDVEEGDRVLFAKYAGAEFKLDTDYKILILTEGDVLAIIGQ